MFTSLSQAAPAVSSAVADFSLTSSTSFPRQLTAEEIQNNNEFHDLGVRSVRDRPGQSLHHHHLTVVFSCFIFLLFTAFDSLAASGPVGHQYHNFTHHLYHHYDPVTNVLDPMTQSLPIERAARASTVSIGIVDSLHKLCSLGLMLQMTRDTQVTPGRFLTPSTTTAATAASSSAIPATAPTANAVTSSLSLQPRRAPSATKQHNASIRDRNR